MRQQAKSWSVVATIAETLSTRIKTMDLSHRFWSKVATTENPNECWEWKACTDRYGYGQLTVQGRHHKAHRVAYELSNGEIPNRQIICHHCDNPRCCNPSHLFLGTHSDNSRDKVSKRRHPFGARNGTTKLTESQVREIARIWNEENLTISVIARQFNVNPGTIHDIVNGRTWKHLNLNLKLA